MAPFVGPTRRDLITRLQARDPDLPITLGRYQPQAVVNLEDGRWVLRTLELDHEATRAAGEAALAAGGMWMPEMEWRYLREGAPAIACDDKADFIRAIERMPWTYGEE